MNKTTSTILGYQTIIMWVISVVIAFDVATMDNILYFMIWFMAAPVIAVLFFLYAHKPGVVRMKKC